MSRRRRLPPKLAGVGAWPGAGSHPMYGRPETGDPAKVWAVDDSRFDPNFDETPGRQLVFGFAYAWGAP